MDGGNDNIPSKTANLRSAREKRKTREVVVFAFDRVQLLDIAGPTQVFATASELCGDAAIPPYRVTVVSLAGGPITTSAGVAVVTRRAAAARPIDTLVVAGGPGIAAAAANEKAVAWVKSSSKAARRSCSVCTGAFLLAAAGMLAGKRAVTHWRACAELARRYPDIRVEADPIFVEDGAVWTSAGVTAGIDLALALVERDLGRRLALRVAQRLVVFLKRPGGQSQFSAALAAQASDDGAFGDLHEWMAAHLEADLRVERLAERAGMSVRTFARLYHAKTGTTPAKAVSAMRVEAARSMLEETPLAIGEIAWRCGFGDEEGMRRAFLRCLGVPPGRYRSRFTPSVSLVSAGWSG